MYVSAQWVSISSDNGAHSAPSHYPKHCWVIVNCTLKNKLRNAKLFFHENAFENIASAMAAILSKGEELMEHKNNVINSPLPSL